MVPIFELFTPFPVSPRGERPETVPFYRAEKPEADHLPLWGKAGKGVNTTKFQEINYKVI